MLELLHNAPGRYPTGEKTDILEENGFPLFTAIPHQANDNSKLSNNWSFGLFILAKVDLHNGLKLGLECSLNEHLRINSRRLVNAQKIIIIHT